MYDLLVELGVEVDDRPNTTRASARRLDDSEADIGTARVGADKRVNIFYYPIDTWADFVIFNFCMDRGAGHQLEDVRPWSYGPWRRGVEGIFKEERMHIRHGELWVKRLAENPATREAERTFHKWYIRTMNTSAGRAAPGTASTGSSVSSAATTMRSADVLRGSPAPDRGASAGRPEWKPAWDTLPGRGPDSQAGFGRPDPAVLHQGAPGRRSRRRHFRPRSGLSATIR